MYRYHSVSHPPLQNPKWHEGFTCQNTEFTLGYDETNIYLMIKQSKQVRDYELHQGNAALSTRGLANTTQIVSG